MKNESLWRADAQAPAFPVLSGHHEVDVLVVGGGITGVTAAYLLKENGRRVAVVDIDKIGGGETSRTTAHVSYVTDSRIGELVEKLGRHEAQAFWDAGKMAMEQIEAIASRHEIKCGLRRVPGYLFAKDGGEVEKEREALQRDAALAAEMGFDAEFIESDPVFERPSVRFANQLKFHPLQYLFALARLIPGGGSHVFEKTDGTQVDEEKHELKTGDGSIKYGQLLVATHVPIQAHRGTLPAALFQTKLAAYSSYVIEAKIADAPEALFWDTDDPYLYVRIDRDDDGTSVIFGGEDHKTGQEPDTEVRYLRLGERLREKFPSAKPQRRWSGQVIETPDGLPYIGGVGDDQYLATGFAGNGITLGTFSAMLITDLIAGKSSPWAELFDPHRKRIAGAWEYLRENKDFPACFIKDHLTPVHDSVADLARCSGGIVKVDGKKCAAYVDEHGKCTVLSPVCPHLGCLVNWNAAEKSWDCPCHGSRFTATGDVFAGPAEQGLGKIEK